MTWTTLAISVLHPILLALGGLLAAYVAAWVRSLKLSEDHRRSLDLLYEAGDDLIADEYAAALADVESAAADGAITAAEWTIIRERAAVRLAERVSSAPSALAPAIESGAASVVGAIARAAERKRAGDLL